MWRKPLIFGDMRAREASEDLSGANLIRALKRLGYKETP
jgi:hypothetical protein